MVARIDPGPSRRGARSHPWAWFVGMILGVFVGEVTMLGPALGLAVGAAALVIAARIGPRRASAGGILLGAGLTISSIVGPRIAACDQVELEPLGACLQTTMSRLLDLGSALVVLGLALSLLAIGRRNGAPGIAPGRLDGAVVGLSITVIAAGLETAFVQPSSSGTFDPLTSSLGPGWGAPTIAAGVLAGWVVGPAARHATGVRDWLLVIAGMGILAVIVGAFAVGFLAGVANGATAMPLPIGLISWVPYGLLLGLVGILVVGPFVLPVTLAAAAIWSIAMAKLRRHAPVAVGA